MKWYIVPNEQQNDQHLHASQPSVNLLLSKKRSRNVKDSEETFYLYNLIFTRWIAGLWPASLLGVRLPNKMGVFATDTVGHLEFPGTKGTFGYNIVRKK